MTKNEHLTRFIVLPTYQPNLLEYFREQTNSKHIILIDPDSQSSSVAVNRSITAVKAGSRMIFVGGSTGTDGNNVHETVVAIQKALESQSLLASKNNEQGFEKWNVPVVLFPACANAFSSAADGITFMMLMNSSSTKFLIEEQLIGASAIKSAKVNPISMGYVVCEPGGKVGEVGKVNLIKENQVELMASYAICAEYFGFSILYLEAGSGASYPVSSNLIKAARAACNLTIIVGGGIRDSITARIAVEAGADWIVTGNLTEQYEDDQILHEVLSKLIEDMN